MVTRLDVRLGPDLPGTDPVTFYGESLGRYRAWALTGTPTSTNYSNGFKAIDDGVTVAATVGDSFILGFYGGNDLRYLTPTDVVGGLKWVLRASGTGTLALADTHDDNWSSTTFTTPFTDLPQLTVDSVGFTDYTFDADPAMRDAALLTGNTMTGEMIDLRVTVTSGTVTFDKARLQIEPVGGIGGSWSGWVVSETRLLGANRVAESNVFYPGEPGITGIVRSIPYNPIGAGAYVEWDEYPDTGGHPRYIEGLLLTPPADWGNPAIRPQFPNDLYYLTEGVDWTVNPYRTMDDVDYYATYDEGPNVHAGWGLGVLSTLVSNASWDGGTIPGSRFQVELHYGLPALAVGAASEIPAMGSGQIIYTSTERYHDYVQDVGPLADPGPVSSVGLFAYDPNLPNTPTPPAGGAYEFRSWVGWRSPDTGFKVQFPHHRYWIPAPGVTPPLRQLQRDDGMVGSTFRAGGGTSRQGSIRQLGYW